MPNWQVPEHALPQKKLAHSWARKPLISRRGRQAMPSKIGGRDINKRPKDHRVLASCWTFRSGRCSFISSKSLCCTSAPGPGPKFHGSSIYKSTEDQEGLLSINIGRVEQLHWVEGLPFQTLLHGHHGHVHLSHRRTELPAEPIDHLDHLDPILDEIGLVNGIHYKIFASQTTRQPRNLRPLSQVWLFSIRETHGKFLLAMYSYSKCEIL